ncbi:MAG TPA: tRNA (5-methylaminomethyl-2-thiouridine)(34)-methyltransferase MnmD [Flavobacterium sp.]|uniref:tRNA (5-methylaminomethyl-2-thiouridine)(34)-methyltransferase MnmD n=1 Tax=unclassified Flavobacterium TaxID=196869 RepID=UPI000E8D1A5A|nr:MULTISPECIES: tRNA (5-methylaminomethyl-2-thiouridine)(34)-methyltransferase MnmD [unclassified Flavobacterium]HBI01557.1 SAM-dependent methyltransferase [Flavobacterium sp.]HRE78849.1 tRNA (5-methylaminomethyl-2-thiouridine)(34)-methyltransferase MnmD [Flavobacterium sp.]
MKREIIITSDGSTSIHLPEWDESYHSKHGAIQEAQHVFIKNGLSLCKRQSVSVLEIGFGTGLNAFITFLESQKSNQNIDYVGVEGFPISAEEVLQMNYVNQLNANQFELEFKKMHQSDWEENVTISEHFRLTKRKQLFNDINDKNQFDIIYFDAFGYRVQPELWSVEIFIIMFEALKEGGILVTYACRGPIKNAMKEAGFQIEKLSGPPGKREMLRGWK